MPWRIPVQTPRPTYCPTCFSLDMRHIPQPHKDLRICTYGQSSRHWITSSDLAMDPSCASCSFLKSAFDTLLKSGEVVDAPSGKQTKYQIAILDRDDGDGADKVTARRIRAAARRSGASRSLKVVMRCSTKGRFKEEFKVEIYTPVGAAPAPWKAVGMAGEVPTKPSAVECAAIIRPWLERCNKDHTLCQTDRTADHQGELLPRRVLDLSGGQIRLIETAQGQRGHYVALSHCWGKEQLLVTTQETIAARMQGIATEQLPRTFQDAIAITRGLDVQYIWIDSLCIIQGDKADWEQQSAVMADIYAGCFLNIATTRSGGGHEGCLDARWSARDSLQWAEEFSKQADRGREKRKQVTRMRKSDVRSFKVPGMEQDIRIRLFLESSHESMQTERWIRQHKDTAPLLLRAWVYQERSLAPRSVHMHSNEMVWVCKVEQRCECRQLDGTPPGGDGWSASKDRIATLGALGDSKSLHGLWRTIVEDFSLLDLTYESDRLPALSGLAYRFAEYFPKNERYLAGLWESDLARDLLWESAGSEPTTGPTKENKSTAPSWSWVSAIGGATDWEHETKPKLAKWAPTTSYKQDQRVKIISASVEIEGQNKYGTACGGYIVIEGAVCAVVVGKSSAEIDNAKTNSESDEEGSSEWVSDEEGDSAELGTDEENSSTESDTDEESDNAELGTDEEDGSAELGTDEEGGAEWDTEEEDGDEEGRQHSSPATEVEPDASSPLPLPPPPPPSFHDVNTVKYSSFNSLHLKYDTPTSEASSGGTVYCLFIGTFIDANDDDRHPHIRHCGLILKPTAGGKFERIGRWKQFVEDWVHNKEVWTKKSGVLRVEIV